MLPPPDPGHSEHGGSADDPTRAEIAAVWAAWNAAMASDDAERIGAFVTREWVIVSGSGVTRR